MKLRKAYAVKLYEYFNHIQNKLEEKICVIKAQSDGIYQEEDIIYNRLKEKKETLEKFDLEITNLSQSKGVLDKKRLQEVRLVREKLDLKFQETQNEYTTFINNLSATEKQWKEAVKILLLNGAKKQKILIRLHQAVASTYPDLKTYCSNWKNEPITRLQNIIKDTQEIRDICADIMSEIKALSSLNMDQQHIANKKSTQIPKSCELVAKRLDLFMNNSDYMDILDKTKDTDPFVNDFFNIFKDSGFTSLRTSIRMVNSISTTEKKLILIHEHFEHIEAIFNQVLEKLYIKKNELVDLCNDVDIYAELICEKWLNSQYQSVLNIVEQISQKRNEFVVNENIL